MPDFFEDSDLDELDFKAVEPPERLGEKEEKELSYGEDDSERVDEETAGEDSYDTDIIRQYFKEAARHRILTGEEEVELCKTINAGKEAKKGLDEPIEDSVRRAALEKQVEEGLVARQSLINHNLRLVISIAKNYRGQGLPFLDLIQEGNIGLIRAVEKYDWQTGNRFSTYAFWWIRQAIGRALFDQSRTIRLPVGFQLRSRQVERVKAQIEGKKGRKASIDELAESLNLSPEQIEDVLKAPNYILSLQRPVKAGEESELGDFVADSSLPDIPMLIEDKSSREALEGILSELKGEIIHKSNGKIFRLSDRDMRIFRLRHGLDAEGLPRACEEVAKIVGLSRERVRQICNDISAIFKEPQYASRLGDGIKAIGVVKMEEEELMQPAETEKKSEVERVEWEKILSELREGIIRESSKKPFRLSPRNEMVFRLRYGLYEEADPMTLREIGEIIGRSRERVRQICDDILVVMREPQYVSRLRGDVKGTEVSEIEEKRVQQPETEEKGLEPPEKGQLTQFAREVIEAGKKLGERVSGVEEEAAKNISSQLLTLLRQKPETLLYLIRWGKINKLEARVVTMKLGLKDGICKTKEEIGRELGISPDEVEEIAKRVLPEVIKQIG